METENTDNPICPYCGYEDMNYFEYNEEGDYYCNSCGKKFHLTFWTEVNFTTSKLKGVTND